MMDGSDLDLVLLGPLHDNAGDVLYGRGVGKGILHDVEHFYHVFLGVLACNEHLEDTYNSALDGIFTVGVGVNTFYNVEGLDGIIELACLVAVVGDYVQHT